MSQSERPFDERLYIAEEKIQRLERICQVFLLITKHPQAGWEPDTRLKEVEVLLSEIQALDHTPEGGDARCATVSR